MSEHLKARAPSRPVVCITNQSDAHLGRFRSLLADEGLEVVEVDAPAADLHAVDLDAAAALVSLGGEMGVHDGDRYPWLNAEIDLLRAAHERGVPILGVCLGGQLLARALGGRVHARRYSEVGWLEVSHLVDDLVLGPKGVRRQFQWHYDAFETPQGAERLAVSTACPDQAFRAGASYGVQFHPEVSQELLTRWVTSEGGRAELIAHGVDPEELLREGAEMEAAYDRQAQTMMAGFACLAIERA
jgi:GMP synthase (glutamine-hydrolysing)